MRAGLKPQMRRLEPADTLTKQDEPGNELFLLLDGVLAVEVDGRTVVEIGPGAILGERALLEGGKRTATLRAVTRCRVAVAAPDQIRSDVIEQVAAGHRREEART